MHMVCTSNALIYYQSFTNGVHPMCTSSALCVTLGSVSTVYGFRNLVQFEDEQINLCMTFTYMTGAIYLSSNTMLSPNNFHVAVSFQ